jgi:hypothetical protein
MPEPPMPIVYPDECERTTTVACPHMRDEVASHFNEPVLIGERIGRCIGYGEDESDCYLLVRHMRDEVVWHSMVAGYVWLDRLAADDLQQLDSLLGLNGSPREKRFAVYAHP